MYVLYKDFSMLTCQTGLLPNWLISERQALLWCFSINLEETWYAVFKWKNSFYVCHFKRFHCSNLIDNVWQRHLIAQNNVIQLYCMTTLFDSAVWLRRFTVPFDYAIWLRLWLRRLTMPFDYAIRLRRLTTPFDYTVWLCHLTAPFDYAVWLSRLTKPFDYAVWLRRLTPVADPYSF